MIFIHFEFGHRIKIRSHCSLAGNIVYYLRCCWQPHDFDEDEIRYIGVVANLKRYVLFL